jgi:hypothetical protein
MINKNHNNTCHCEEFLQEIPWQSLTPTYKKITLTNPILFTFLCILLLASSCRKLEQNVDLNLPPFESQLQIECYLENRQEPCNYRGFSIPSPYIKAALFETQDYFGELDTPFVDSATVIVSANGNNYTLSNNMIPELCDTINLKLFNYKNYDGPFSIQTNTKYTLYAKDKKGRIITAETECLPIIKIDTVKVTYDEKSDRAFFVAYFYEPAATADYYRARYVNLSTKDEGKRNLRDSYLIDDAYNGTYFPFGGSADYNEGDTIELSLYHITRDYYQYLRTLDGAASAAGNPFGSPSFIESNIKGGTGIFTCLPRDVYRFVINK